MPDKDNDTEEYTMQEVNEAFKHSAKELARMAPYDHMQILQKRIDVCISKLYSLSSRYSHCEVLFDTLKARKAKLKEEGNGPKSLGITIVNECAKRRKDEMKEIGGLRRRYRTLRNQAAEQKDQVLRDFGTSVLRRSNG